MSKHYSANLLVLDQSNLSLLTYHIDSKSSSFNYILHSPSFSSVLLAEKKKSKTRNVLLPSLIMHFFTYLTPATRGSAQIYDPFYTCKRNCNFKPHRYIRPKEFVQKDTSVQIHIYTTLYTLWYSLDSYILDLLTKMSFFLNIITLSIFSNNVPKLSLSVLLDN